MCLTHLEDQQQSVEIIEQEKIRISVRNLVEFVFRSGDIDNRVGKGVRQEAMQEGSRMHRKIQKRMGSEYRSEVTLKQELIMGHYLLSLEGRADGIFWRPAPRRIADVPAEMQEGISDVPAEMQEGISDVPAAVPKEISSDSLRKAENSVGLLTIDTNSTSSESGMIDSAANHMDSEKLSGFPEGGQDSGNRGSVIGFVSDTDDLEERVST